MKSNLLNTMSRSLNRGMFKVKKHSPEILVVAGVAGTIVSTVMACKATLKVNDILNETKDDIEKIHSVAADSQYSDRYSEEDYRKDLIITYTKTGIELFKLYAPSIILGTLSLGSILASNNILRKRNAALAAAYTTVDNCFKEYRGRVVERFGEKIDKELRYNIKATEIEETVVDENGETTTVKKTVDVVDPNEYSEYARFFDDGCKGWTKDPGYNLSFLRCQQSQANDKLKANGYLFLNEVYDMLGIPKSKAGQVVGWVYDAKHPIGDNYVDFGIYDMYRKTNRDFVNGYERVILLDFNVDGNIWELM